jgi:hypothetical protein
MGAVVNFNYQQWKARYPEFCGVSEPTAQAYFNEAQIYHRNDAMGPVQNPSVQLTMLNMVTAHLAAIYSGTNGQPASPLVGRVSQAAEGSVNVSTDMTIDPGSEQWWAQTKYGLAYWTAAAPYRTMQYVPGFPRPTNPFFYRR